MCIAAATMLLVPEQKNASDDDLAEEQRQAALWRVFGPHDDVPGCREGCLNGINPSDVYHTDPYNED